MSSASISVFRITCARSSAAPAVAASANASGCGCVSWTRRWSVQCPPPMTFVPSPPPPGGPAGPRERAPLGRRLRLLAQTLERPVPATDDLRRHARERDDRTELPRPSGELERGDVVLDPPVVGGERRGADERDAPVRVHEPTAGPRGRG